jgi:hypothetical protein
LEGEEAAVVVAVAHNTTVLR